MYHLIQLHVSDTYIRQYSVCLGDSLRLRICPFWPLAIIPARTITSHVRGRDGHHLGRCSRHDSSVAYSGKISRPSDGSFSIEQPRAPSAGANRNRFDRSPDRAASSNLLWRGACFSGYATDGVASAGNSEVPVGRNRGRCSRKRNRRGRESGWVETPIRAASEIGGRFFSDHIPLMEKILLGVLD